MALIKYIERIDRNRSKPCLVDSNHPEDVLTGGTELTPSERHQLYVEWGKRYHGFGGEEERALEHYLDTGQLYPETKEDSED